MIEVDRQDVARIAAALQLQDLAVFALDHDRGLQGRGALVEPVIDDHTLGNTGRLVDGFRHGRAFDEIFEADLAVDLGQDRPRIGIPFRDTLAALDLVAFVDLHPRAILDAVHRTLDAIRPFDDDRDIARHDHQVAFGIAREMPVADLHRAVEIAFEERRSAICAAPPMWKVRIVSCVPGSPIDCAAMTPTASPMLTGVPRARSRP